MTAVESTALPLVPPPPCVPVAGAAELTAFPTVPTPRLHGRTTLRAVLLAGLVLAFAVTCSREGLPTDRVVLLGWVLAGLAAYAATDGLHRVGRLLVDWLPLA